MTVSRTPRMLLASAFLASAIASAPALSEPAKPAANLGQVKGESMDDKHKDAIMVGDYRCAGVRAGPMTGVASDPEEGGQVTMAKKGTTKPHVSDINVMKTSDKSSPMMMQSSAAGPCGH